MTRQMLWRMLGADDPMEAHKIDSRAIRSRGASGDAKEGVTSFLEKRPAKFPGKVSSRHAIIFPLVAGTEVQLTEIQLDRDYRSSCPPSAVLSRLARQQRYITVG